MIFPAVDKSVNVSIVISSVNFVIPPSLIVRFVISPPWLKIVSIPCSITKSVILTPDEEFSIVNEPELLYSSIVVYEKSEELVEG